VIKITRIDEIKNILSVRGYKPLSQDMYVKLFTYSFVKVKIISNGLEYVVGAIYKTDIGVANKGRLENKQNNIHQNMVYPPEISNNPDKYINLLNYLEEEAMHIDVTIEEYEKTLEQLDKQYGLQIVKIEEDEPVFKLLKIDEPAYIKLGLEEITIIVGNKAKTLSRIITVDEINQALLELKTNKNMGNQNDWNKKNKDR